MLRLHAALLKSPHAFSKSEHSLKPASNAIASLSRGEMCYTSTKYVHMHTGDSNSLLKTVLTGMHS